MNATVQRTARSLRQTCTQFRSLQSVTLQYGQPQQKQGSILSSGTLLNTHLHLQNALPKLPSMRCMSALPERKDHAQLEQAESPHSLQAREAFDKAWARLEQSGLKLVFPREIIWLNGAPGSGKSENSRFMMDLRGYANEPIVISELLESTGMKSSALIANGRLVDDQTVLEVLLFELLNPTHRAGALVDGFPRTPAQVETLPLLRDKIRALHSACVPGAPPPRFFVCILHVGRTESMRRQQLRGLRACEHNRRVRESGHGTLIPERDTDFDCELIEKRYAIFDDHRDTLQALRDHFHFTVIDSERPLNEVRDQIESEFQYQSSRELAASTYSTINDVPRADTLRFNARDGLVLRLDGYQARQPGEFAAAVDFVRARVVPSCRMAAFSGVAQLRIEPEDPLYLRFDEGVFPQMVMDVLAERGYAPCMSRWEYYIPMRAKEDGSVECSRRIVHKLNVRFPPATLTGTTR